MLRYLSEHSEWEAKDRGIFGDPNGFYSHIPQKSARVFSFQRRVALSFFIHESHQSQVGAYEHASWPFSKSELPLDLIHGQRFQTASKLGMGSGEWRRRGVRTAPTSRAITRLAPARCASQATPLRGNEDALGP